MDKDKFLQTGLLEQYVLGLTSLEEDRVVEEHLRAFPELQEEVDILKGALHNYATQQLASASLPELADTPAAAAEVDLASRYQTRLNLALIACLILAAVATLLYRSYAAQAEHMSHLQAEFTTLKEVCTSQLEEEKKKSAIYQLMHAQATRPILLQPNPRVGSDFFAVAYWNPEKKAGWLDPTHLPPLADNEEYYIWADVDEQMVPIGKIAPGEHHPIAIAFQQNASSINITRETAGPHDHPNLNGLTASGMIQF